MIKGIIPGDRSHMRWVSDEDYKYPVISSLLSGIKLSDKYNDIGIDSFYCNYCKKIVIDVEEKG